MRKAAIFACSLLLVAGAAAQSVRAPEYEVKAAFLYNFAKFVQWPAQALPETSSAIRLCVLGEDPFGPALARVIEGKSVAGHPVIRVRPQSSAEVRLCHVLFISSSDPDTLRQVLTHTSDVPVLTVSESPDFLRLGGMINFVLEQDRLRFEINLQAAQYHHLTLSSKLLAVARVVDVGQGDN